MRGEGGVSVRESERKVKKERLKEDIRKQEKENKEIRIKIKKRKRKVILNPKLVQIDNRIDTLHLCRMI